MHSSVEISHKFFSYSMKWIIFFMPFLAIQVVKPIEAKAMDSLYASKEDCLSKLSAVQDNANIGFLCDSLVYPPTEKERLEKLKVQRQIEKQREEAYEEAIEMRRQEWQKKLENDPTYQRQQLEQAKLFRCRLEKENLERQQQEQMKSNRRLSSYQLSPECWGLFGL